MLWFNTYEEPQETFEEYLTAQGGTAAAFSGTAAANDTATQEALAGWFWEYRLGREPDAFAKYFKRELGDLYPRYLNMVRIQSVQGNMDPFLTEYMEHKNKTTGTTTGTTSGKKTTSGSGEESTTYGRTTNETHSDTATRTDDLTENTTAERKNTGTQGTKGTNTNKETRTDDLTENTTGSENGSGTEKARNVAEAYPEADLGEISMEPADTLATSYASSAANGNRKTTDEKTTSGERTNTGTQETDGSGSTEETRTDNLAENSTGKRTNTGTQGTVASGERGTTEGGKDGKTRTDSGTEETSGSNSGSTEENGEGQTQGRHESVADILPRAIAALEQTDAFRWLCAGLMVCFDPFS